MNDWSALAEKALDHERLSRAECRAVLEASSADTPSLIAAASRVRFRYFGRRVRLNFLHNIKSGLCAEDCHYCSQAKGSGAPVAKYPMQSTGETLRVAERALAAHAGRLCMVASGRGPSDRELDQFIESVRAVREAYPRLEICACLGLLAEGQAEKLKAAGVFAVNHNLNTSESHYGEICRTHTYRDRVATVENIQKAGLSACSGALVGMGETADDIIDLAFALRGMNVESLPVNFLMPIPGTPLGNQRRPKSKLQSPKSADHASAASDLGASTLDLGPYVLTPTRCLNVLALFRLTNPKASLRISGGREIHLRSLQAQGLYVANSIFIGDYLTTKGQAADADLAMIRDLDFEIEGDGVRDPASDVQSPPEVVLK